MRGKDDVKIIHVTFIHREFKKGLMKTYNVDLQYDIYSNIMTQFHNLNVPMIIFVADNQTLILKF